jgi:hypothetical protein
MTQFTWGSGSGVGLMRRRPALWLGACQATYSATSTSRHFASSGGYGPSPGR